MRLTLLIPILVLTAGCAASTYPLNPQMADQVGLSSDGPSFLERVGRDPDGSGPIVQRGHCSWYGPGFHGRRTASGETFDTNDLTAAHPTLPFGSQLEVTNVENGRSVRVRVNDRGPYIGNRILDLSRAAAVSLGMTKSGVAEVQVRLVDVDESNLPETVYALQVGTFKSQVAADRFVKSLSVGQRAASLYYIKKSAPGRSEYHVRFGPFSRETDANDVSAKLKRAGLKPALVEEDLCAPAQDVQTAAQPGHPAS